MKKFLILVLLGLSVIMAPAQKKSGLVYSEHDAIEKAKSMWTAFVSGDKEKFLSFWADTVKFHENGIANVFTKSNFEEVFNWWRGIDKLTVEPDVPAFPDAIQYNNGQLWVQDWMRIKGTHKETGVRIDVPFHYIYGFDKENKINIVFNYYNKDFFTTIERSYKTRENGKIYINHPYIVTVRKLVNAYVDEDIETLFSIYAPDARFGSSMMKDGQSIGVEEKKKEDIMNFTNVRERVIEQVGYPDCIYYEQENYYTVFSWWTMSFTANDGKKWSGIPVMMAHSFNKEGKIAFEMVYVSSNHFE